MENIMLDILDEVLDTEKTEKEEWKIKNDEEADWWIEIHEEKLVEVRRLRMQLKKTKTMMKYRLPSGELVKKFKAPEFKRNNDKLVKWLEDNQMDEYIEVKKQPKWKELKKAVKVINGAVVTEDGEIVEGVEVVERAPEFKVEV